MEMHSYVNDPPRPRPIRRSHPADTERKWTQTVLLSFGLLCLTQATLNITLRLTSKCECNTATPDSQTSPPTPATDEQESQPCKALCGRLKALESEKRRLENKNTELTNQINAANDQIKELNNQKSDLNNQIARLNNKNSKLTNQNRELSNQIIRLTNQNRELSNQITGLTNQNRELNNQITGLTNQNGELNSRITGLTNQNRELNSRITGLTNQNRELNNRINGLNNKNRELTDQNRELNKQVNDLNHQISVLNKQQETVTVMPCPDGWREMRGRCYFLSSEMRSWDDSRRHCQNLGADLVVIDDEQEQRGIYRMNGSRYLLFWIGLHDDANRGRFKWVDNTPLTRVFWKEGQPGDGGRNNPENCVEMYNEDPVLSCWNDAPCSKPRRWVCEKEARQ